MLSIQWREKASRFLPSLSSQSGVDKSGDKSPGNWRSVSALEKKVCSAMGACEAFTTWFSDISEGFFLEGVISMLSAEDTKI